MKLPLQLVFRDIASSPALEAEVHKRAMKLERFEDRITSCRVTLGTAGRHKHQGKLYQVHVDLTVPGFEIVVDGRHENEDMHIAIRDAFDAATRQLEDHIRRRREIMGTKREDGASMSES
jgi:ribosomal subunit interface protein